MVGTPALRTADPPGVAAWSTTATRLPKKAAWAAAFSPAGPAPITIMSNESFIFLRSFLVAAALAGSSAGSPGGPDGDNRAEVLEEPLGLVAELGLHEVLVHLGDVVELQAEVEAAAAVAGRVEPVRLPDPWAGARGGLQRDQAVLLVFSDGEGEVGLAAHDVVDLQDLGAGAGRAGPAGPDPHHVGLPPGVGGEIGDGGEHRRCRIGVGDAVTQAGDAVLEVDHHLRCPFRKARCQVPGARVGGVWVTGRRCMDSSSLSQVSGVQKTAAWSAAHSA